jgi:PAS domain S-box-containing protein
MAIEKEQWFEELRDLAEKITAQKNDGADQINTSDLSSLLHEFKVYQAELEIQNEELRRTQTELMRSRDRFEALFQEAPAGYMVLSKDGLVLEANHTASKMLQRERSKLLNSPFSSYIIPEDRGLFLARFSALYKNPKGKSVEVRMNRFDESSFYARMEARFIPILHDAAENRLVDHFCLLITNITKTKEAENALKTSESEYRNLVNSMNDAIILADTNGKIILFNPSAERLFKCNMKEALGSPIARFCPSELRTEQTEMLRQVLANGFVPPYQTERLTAEGRHVPVEISLSTRTDDYGKSIGFLAVFRDLTDLKAVVRKARESDLRFRSFVESANDLVYTIDPDGLFTYISPNWLEFVGEPAEKAVGTSFEPYVHPDDLHLCQQFLQRVLSTGKKQSSVEYRVRRWDGSWRWHYSNGAPLTDADGNVVGYLGIARDITKRKEIEAQLEDNERYMRSILQTTVDGFWEIDSNGRIVEVNQAYCALSGYDRNEIIGMHISNLEATESPEETAVHFQGIMSTGHDIFETWHRRKDGSVFPLEVSVTFIDLKGGRMVCFCRNLTERKVIEREREDLISELKGALAQVKMLSGLLPICSHCKKIRDDKGYWNQIEAYLTKHSEAKFSHGICKECAKKYYPDFDVYDD